MFDHVEFVFAEAIQGMRRHGLMTFAAISTVAVALYLIGGLGYVYFQIQNYAESLSSKYEIQAFFKDEASMNDVMRAAKAVRRIPGVGAAVHIPKARAWEKTQRENPELTIGLENPYPDAMKITVKDLKKTTDIVVALKAMPEFQSDAIMYHDPTQRFLNDLLSLVRWLWAVLGGLLTATAGILIYNAIRLTIDGRRREIRIMQLVGASHLTVRAPFVIEGAIEGAIGGILATGLLWATYGSLAAYVEANLTTLSSMKGFAVGWVLMCMFALGSLYGVLCSVLAIRKPIRLRGEAI